MLATIAVIPALKRVLSVDLGSIERQRIDRRNGSGKNNRNQSSNIAMEECR